MALSGDITTAAEGEGIISFEDKRPAIRFDADIHVSGDGLVSQDESDPMIMGIIKVVNGDMKEILHLIGHKHWKVDELLEDGVLYATDEINEKLRDFGPRSPGSYLVVNDNKLYGVVVDETTDCRVVGEVNCVVPNHRELKTGGNTVIINGAGNWRIVRSTDINIRSQVANGKTFVMVSEAGFAFVNTENKPKQQQQQELAKEAEEEEEEDDDYEGAIDAEDIIQTDPDDKELPKLILVVRKGYLLVEDAEVCWTRLQVGLRDDQFLAKTTQVMPLDCVASRCGCFLRRDDSRYDLYGSYNACLKFESLMKMIDNLKPEDNNRQTPPANSPLQNPCQAVDVNVDDDDDDNDYEVNDYLDYEDVDQEVESYESIDETEVKSSESNRQKDSLLRESMAGLNLETKDDDEVEEV